MATFDAPEIHFFQRSLDGEEQVNGFRCRKMTYRLERDGKSAERPALICWGKANEYAGSDSWVGVF